MPAALYGNTEYGEFTPGGDDDAAHGFIDGGDSDGANVILDGAGSLVGALDYSGGAV